MKVIQDSFYIVTEWDGTDEVVKVRTVGGRVVRRRADGTPFLKTGGDVLMLYRDGVCHRVTARYFGSLSPRLNGWNPAENEGR
jgi:hypothetical protein